MTKAKIAVTLPRPLVVKAKQAVKDGRVESVSAYVAAALEEKTMLDELKTMLDQMLAETGGSPTRAERQEAERMLGIRQKRRPRSAA